MTEKYRKLGDPLGGVRGDDVKTTNPFSVDKKAALQELNISIDWIEGRRRKSDKTVLQRMRDGSWGKEEKIPNWEPSKDSEFDGVDVILRWAGKEVTRVRNVNKKEAKIALSGLKAFIRNIDVEEPDFSNVWVVKCYNITAKNYRLDPVKEPSKEEQEGNISLRKHPHIFAGIQGDDSVLSKNRFLKDVKRAIKLTDETIAFLEIVDVNPRKRPPEFRRMTKTILCKPTYRTTNTHFDISLVFANKTIFTENNVPLPKAKIAVSSMRGWLRALDCENPQLDDDTVAACYKATQERTKPGNYGKIREELLPVDEGGTSYWSSELHCWITGHVDKDGVFIPPDWTK